MKLLAAARLPRRELQWQSVVVQNENYISKRQDREMSFTYQYSFVN